MSPRWIGDAVRITITIELLDEYVDEEHEWGINEEGYLGLMLAVNPYGKGIELSRAER